MTATSASWKHLPPPSAREDLGFEGVFTDDELEKIVQGFVPGEMEDKWFIYFEDGWLRFHRSWTGAFIYALRFEKTPSGARAVESWVNRDPQQYVVTNTEYDRRFLRFLINTLLLKEGVTQRVYVRREPTIFTRTFTVVRGLIYSVAFIGLWIWIAAYVRGFDPQIPLAIPGWLFPVGLALALTGGLVAAACIGTFLTVGRGTPAPFDPPRKFVAAGPYRYVRNPMYLGAAAVILGGGLAIASPAIVLLTLGFLLLMHLFVVLYEEDALARRFGDSYRRYKATVPRWQVRWPSRGEET